MNLIDKGWKRVVISGFLGGMLAEIVHINTGSDKFDNFWVGIGFLVSFLIFSAITYSKNKKNSRSRSYQDDLLDD